MSSISSSFSLPGTPEPGGPQTTGTGRNNPGVPRLPRTGGHLSPDRIMRCAITTSYDQKYHQHLFSLTFFEFISFASSLLYLGKSGWHGWWGGVWRWKWLRLLQSNNKKFAKPESKNIGFLVLPWQMCYIFLRNIPNHVNIFKKILVELSSRC